MQQVYVSPSRTSRTGFFGKTALKRINAETKNIFEEGVRKADLQYDKSLKELNENIEKAHKNEVLKIEKARVTLETTMKEVEIKYAEAEKQLDSKKKKQVEKIIKENHDDPDTITEKLASLTGFEIYVE